MMMPSMDLLVVPCQLRGPGECYSAFRKVDASRWGEGRTSLPAKPAIKRCVLRQAMGEVNLRRGWAGGSLGPTPVKVNPANRLLLLMPYDRRPLLAASRHIKDDLHAAKTRLRLAPGYLFFAEYDAVL